MSSIISSMRRDQPMSSVITSVLREDDQLMSSLIRSMLHKDDQLMNIVIRSVPSTSPSLFGRTQQKTSMNIDVTLGTYFNYSELENCRRHKMD
jgi:hypothetical protein